jgi:hypothetical protein
VSASSDGPPLPGWIWREILAFLAARSTGRIVLNIAVGHIVEGEVQRRLQKP